MVLKSPPPVRPSGDRPCSRRPRNGRSPTRRSSARICRSSNASSPRMITVPPGQLVRAPPSMPMWIARHSGRSCSPRLGDKVAFRQDARWLGKSCGRRDRLLDRRDHHSCGCSGRLRRGPLGCAPAAGAALRDGRCRDHRDLRPRAGRKAAAIAPSEMLDDIFTIAFDDRKVFLGLGSVRFPIPRPGDGEVRWRRRNAPTGRLCRLYSRRTARILPERSARRHAGGLAAGRRRDDGRLGPAPPRR